MHIILFEKDGKQVFPSTKTYKSETEVDSNLGVLKVVKLPVIEKTPTNEGCCVFCNGVVEGYKAIFYNPYTKQNQTVHSAYGECQSCGAI